jgi:hypothetical protein
MRNLLAYLCCLYSLIACQSDRPFEPTDEVAALVGDDLKEWLLTAPFDNYWDPQADVDGDYVFTNVKQVFPFVGNYYDAVDKYDRAINLKDQPVFEEYTMVFKDKFWGESVIHGTLMYKPDDLYLARSYSQSGDVIFDGINNIGNRYNATLAETQSYRKDDEYTAGLYWVRSNGQRYLSGFYQKDHLIMQFGFPVKDTLQSIAKVKEINSKMGLNINEWKNLQPADLTVNKEPVSFWKDPYRGIYITAFLPELKLKLKDTKFVEQNPVKINGVAYQYGFVTPDNHRFMGIRKLHTELNKEDFEEKMESIDLSITTNRFGKKLFTIAEESQQNKTIIKVYTYFKNNQYFEIAGQFPSDDKVAHKEFSEILKTIKINIYNPDITYSENRNWKSSLCEPR